MWGNRCDLSVSAGKDNSQTSNPLKQIGQLDEFILVDDYECLWSYLLAVRDKTISSGKGRIDLVLDNAGSLCVYTLPLFLCIFHIHVFYFDFIVFYFTGFELLTDLCLAEMLLAMHFASQIVFHMKSYPWFVSDTTDNDVKYCISRLQESKLLVERTQGAKWVTRVNEGE